MSLLIISPSVLWASPARFESFVRDQFKTPPVNESSNIPRQVQISKTTASRPLDNRVTAANYGHQFKLWRKPGRKDNSAVVWRKNSGDTSLTILCAQRKSKKVTNSDSLRSRESTCFRNAENGFTALCLRIYHASQSKADANSVLNMKDRPTVEHFKHQ